MGGSQREERLDVLKRRLEEIGLPEEPYWWYMDLRKYGTGKYGCCGVALQISEAYTNWVCDRSK